MFNDEGSAFRAHDPALHYLSSNYTLLGVEIGTRLIDQVNIARLGETEDNGHTLELTTGECLHIVIEELIDMERV